MGNKIRSTERALGVSLVIDARRMDRRSFGQLEARVSLAPDAAPIEGAADVGPCLLIEPSDVTFERCGEEAVVLYLHSNAVSAAGGLTVLWKSAAGAVTGGDWAGVADVTFSKGQVRVPIRGFGRFRVVQQAAAPPAGFKVLRARPNGSYDLVALGGGGGTSGQKKHRRVPPRALSPSVQAAEKQASSFLSRFRWRKTITQGQAGGHSGKRSFRKSDVVSARLPNREVVRVFCYLHGVRRAASRTSSMPADGMAPITALEAGGTVTLRVWLCAARAEAMWWMRKKQQAAEQLDRTAADFALVAEAPYHAAQRELLTVQLETADDVGGGAAAGGAQVLAAGQLKWEGRPVYTDLEVTLPRRRGTARFAIWMINQWVEQPRRFTAMELQLMSGEDVAAARRELDEDGCRVKVDLQLPVQAPPPSPLASEEDEYDEDSEYLGSSDEALAGQRVAGLNHVARVVLELRTALDRQDMRVLGSPDHGVHEAHVPEQEDEHDRHGHGDRSAE